MLEIIDLDDRKSTWPQVILAGAAISWISNKQSDQLYLSTIKGEYVTLSSAAKKTL